MPSSVPAISACGTTGSGPLGPMARDPARLESVLGRHVLRLRRWARGRLQRRVRAGVDTSDIVQEVLVRLLARLDLFQPRSHRALAAYLRTAVRHRLVDIHRHQRRWPGVDLDDHLPSRQPSPLQHAVDAETWRRYRQALAALSRRDRELVVGHLELEYTHAQLGCMIGRSPNAARMALARAMARLAERMAPQ